jgi:myosin-6
MSVEVPLPDYWYSVYFVASYWYIMEAIFYFSVKNKILYRRASLITIQKNVRMFLAKRIHQPRYRGIAKINSLQVPF